MIYLQVYWLGPILGGVVAALLYDNVLASNASLRKARDLMMSSKFDDEKYPKRRPIVRVVEYEEENEEQAQELTESMETNRV